VFGLGDLPHDLGGVCGDAAVDLAVKELDDLGAALGPPELGGGDLFAVVEEEGVGELREGIGLGLVVVGGVGGVGAAVAAAAEGGDVEEIEGAMVILLGREMDDRGVGRGGGVGLGAGWGDESEDAEQGGDDGSDEVRGRDGSRGAAAGVWSVHGTVLEWVGGAGVVWERWMGLVVDGKNIRKRSFTAWEEEMSRDSSVRAR
jgi:hypothetical protein